MVQYIPFLGDNYCKAFTGAGNPYLIRGKKNKRQKGGRDLEIWVFHSHY